MAVFEFAYDLIWILNFLKNDILSARATGLRSV